MRILQTETDNTTQTTQDTQTTDDFVPEDYTMEDIPIDNVDLTAVSQQVQESMQTQFGGDPMNPIFE